MDIYIKPRMKAAISQKNKIVVKDVAEILATQKEMKKINDIKIINIASDKKDSYLISVIDIVKVIKKEYPESNINNLGEMDTFVEYSPVKYKGNKILLYLKVLFVSFVLFVGSATAVMSFHTDAQMPKVFQNLYLMLFGVENVNPLIIEVPYAIGLALGIIIFFNHFIGKKITDDPTPIEVQMSSYDSEVSETIIDILDLKKLKKEQGGGNGDSN